MTENDHEILRLKKENAEIKAKQSELEKRILDLESKNLSADKH